MQEKSRETYFITGSTGFLGSSLVPQLISKGYNLILLVRAKNDTIAQEKIHSLFSTELQSYITIVRGDLTDIQKKQKTNSLISDKIKIKGVFHLAAGLSFRSKDREELVNSNINGTKQISWLCEELDVPLVYISTAYVHGKRKGILPENELEHPFNFNNPYEESKFHAEKYIRSRIKRQTLSAVIIRPGIIVGQTHSAKNIKSSFGLYAIIQATHALQKDMATYVQKHTFMAILLGLKIQKTVLISKYIPMPVTNTHIHFVPLPIVINTILRISDSLEESLGKTYNVVPPNPISIRDITKISLLVSSIQMPILTVPKMLTISFFYIVKYLSYIIKPLSSLSKKFYYYEYYLTNTYQFDLTEVNKIYRKIDTSSFNNQYKYFLNGAEYFAKRLEEN